MKKARINAFIGLSLIYLSVFFELYWLFGIFFLAWAINDIITGSTYVFGEIRRSDTPFTFWFTVFTWIGLALIYFFMM